MSGIILPAALELRGGMSFATTRWGQASGTPHTTLTGGNVERAHSTCYSRAIARTATQGRIIISFSVKIRTTETSLFVSIQSTNRPQAGAGWNARLTAGRMFRAVTSTTTRLLGTTTLLVIRCGTTY